MDKDLALGFRIAQLIIDADQDKEAQKPIAPEANKTLFDLTIDVEGISENVFADLLERIVLHSPKTANKSFFNQLYGGRNKPAMLAEILSTVTNNSMYTYKVAGVYVAIEKEVLDTMRTYIGFHDGDGAFMPGGSLSNMTAMMIARNEKITSFADQGSQELPLCCYSSDQAHYSIEKNAAILGIGKKNLRKIPSNHLGKMDVIALEKAIQKDLLDGAVPFFINATAGTTVLGAFDPIEDVLLIAKKYKLWLHVDAAWGGGVLLSEKYKYLMAGIAEADSVSWNAHKMMNVPLVASALLMKKKALLFKHYSQKNDYLFQNEVDEWNPGLSSLQCGRRNDAFKVWAAWKYFGKEAYAKRTEKQFELAAYATAIVKEDPLFQLVLKPEFLNVCFTVKGISAIDLCNGLYEQGLLQVSYGRWKTEVFVRLVLVNPDMEHKDIDHFFNTIKAYVAMQMP